MLTILTLETTQGHISHEEVTYGLDAVNKIEDRTQEQENVKTPQTVVDIELHKPADTDESEEWLKKCNQLSKVKARDKATSKKEKS